MSTIATKIQSKDINPAYFDLIQNALLHLYSVVSASTRFYPTHARNKILIDFFKARVKKSEYKPVKSSIKDILSLSKIKGLNLELKIREVEKYNRAFFCPESDVDLLFQLFRYFENNGIDTKLSSASEQNVVECVYLDEDCFNQNVNDENQFTGPVLLTISNRSKNIELVADILNGITSFNYRKKESNDGHVAFEIFTENC
ncbi:DUF2913 family protein [Photobacterium leiognathi]|uniref:DUF2913 family protein n=1 Tax=Photobacterium leiognathi TaxID=553611 RepID=UPI0029818FD3|nr:DUF2913 family protein [Photobacterium leiognathi]